AVIFVFARVVFRLFGISGGVFFLPVLFTNTANLGYPVNLFFWGAGSFPYAASYSVTIAVLLFTFGIYLITPELPVRNRLKNIFGLPVIYAYAAGILLHYTGMPEFIGRLFFICSIPAIPLMLVIAGSSLIYSRWELNRKVAAGLVARFGGGFLVFLLLLFFFDLTPLYMKVIVTNVFLPAAVMNYILAVKFKQNKDYVANMIGFSTLIYSFVFLMQLLFFHKLF
ncbi:MAG: AEC family transporter, partial [bacterium]